MSNGMHNRCATKTGNAQNMKSSNLECKIISDSIGIVTNCYRPLTLAK